MTIITLFTVSNCKSTKHLINTKDSISLRDSFQYKITITRDTFKVPTSIIGLLVYPDSLHSYPMIYHSGRNTITVKKENGNSIYIESTCDSIERINLTLSSELSKSKILIESYKNSSKEVLKVSLKNYKYVPLWSVFILLLIIPLFYILFKVIKFFTVGNKISGIKSILKW